MERIEQPKTAVPLEVQKVLDAMTERNWSNCGWHHYDRKTGKINKRRMCFAAQADRLLDKQDGPLFSLPVMEDLNDRSEWVYGLPVGSLNDSCDALSDFKSKIIALYQEAP